jgi:hypothetical protein
LTTDTPPISLYLDDDMERVALHRALGERGHDVVRATDVGNRGKSDLEHLDYAASNGRVLVTANARDFQRLHNEWQSAGRTHAGIIIVTPQSLGVGELVRRLSRLSSILGSEGMTNWLEYLSPRWG